MNKEQHIYYYRAFNIIFSSQWAIPYLEKVDNGGEVDVVIRRGVTPENLEKPVTQKILHQTAPGEFLFKMEGVADYYLYKGHSIIVNPQTDETEAINLFLTGIVFTALLHQRKFMVLHASVVEIGNGKSVAFAGKSGSGKSTLAAQFVQSEYNILSDDIGAILINEQGEPMVYPVFPQLKIWEDVVKHMGLSGSGLSQVRSNLRKYGKIESEHFCREPKILAALYFLSTEEGDGSFKIGKLTGMEKFQHLLNQVHKPEIMKGEGNEALQFKMYGQMKDAVRMKKLTHSYKLADLDEVVEGLERDFSKMIE